MQNHRKSGEQARSKTKICREYLPEKRRIRAAWLLSIGSQLREKRAKPEATSETVPGHRANREKSQSTRMNFLLRAPNNYPASLTLISQSQGPNDSCRHQTHRVPMAARTPRLSMMSKTVELEVVSQASSRFESHWYRLLYLAPIGLANLHQVQRIVRWLSPLGISIFAQCKATTEVSFSYSYSFALPEYIFK